MHALVVYTLYDTIRYDTVDTVRALKSWRDGQLNLAHGPETKNNGKNQNQKPSGSEETVRQKSVEAVREEEEKVTSKLQMKQPILSLDINAVVWSFWVLS